MYSYFFIGIRAWCMSHSDETTNFFKSVNSTHGKCSKPIHLSKLSDHSNVVFQEPNQ